MRVLILICSVLLTTTASAELRSTLLYPENPYPAQLSAYTMIRFPADPRPVMPFVTYAPGPTGDIIFRQDNPFWVRLTDAGIYWGGTIARRSYDGDMPPEHPLSLLLPSGTGAFTLWCSDRMSGSTTAQVTAITASGLTLTQTAGVGRFFDSGRGFGFWTEHSSDPIVEIRLVEISGLTDYRFGAFSIASIPEPNALLLILAGMTMIRGRSIA